MSNKDEQIKKEEPSIDKKASKEKGKDKIAQLEEELEKAKADANNWKNEYYKAYADTQNLRKTLEEEKREAIKYRSAGFLEELLPAIDSMYMALSIPPKNDEIKNYLMGFQFIYNQISNTLSNEGITEVIPEIGNEYDPNVMQAVDTVESDDDVNKVVKVYAKGYKLHERLIRPAMVSVTKKKVEEAKKEETTEENKAEEKPAEDKAQA